MMVGAVIFDVDGTLVDSVGLHVRAWQETFRRFGRDVSTEQIHASVGLGGKQLITACLSQAECDRFGAQLEEDCAGLFKREYLQRVCKFPRVQDLFVRLKADRKRIALATTAGEKEVARYIHLLGVAGLLDAVTSGHEIETDRPDPEFFRPALAKLGEPEPARVAVIADTPSDMAAARRGGMCALGVLSGGFTAEELHEGGASAVYRDVAQLLEQYDGSVLGRGGERISTYRPVTAGSDP